jgi:hypothetical protein
MADPANSLLPLFSALGGFLTGAVSEYLRDSRTRAREREARESARRLQLFERRSDFQRETLLTLQRAISALTRATGKMYHLDEMEFRKTGKWGGNLFPEDLDSACHEASVKTLMRLVRVRDDAVREMANTFRTSALEVSLCKSQGAAEQKMRDAISALDPLNERIELILRKLDDDEESSELKR